MKTWSYLLVGISVALPLGLGGAVVAQETGPPSETEITTADCEQSWEASAASSSCTTIVLEAEPAPGSSIVNNCAVKANCASTEGGDHDSFSDYHGGPEGVETLLNCAGTLATDC